MAPLTEKMKLILDAYYLQRRRIPPRNGREWAGWWLACKHAGRKAEWPIYISGKDKEEAEKIIKEVSSV